MSSIRLGVRLNLLLANAGLDALDDKTVRKFDSYLSLFVRWNERISLSAARDEESILSTHLVESIAVARQLPNEIATLLDFGSGGGLPGIPIALCRPAISVTLAESQGRKAAFLEEAVRELGISAKVYARRAESLGERFDCVILRAVDRMPKAVGEAATLVARRGWLALMTTDLELAKLQRIAGAEFTWGASFRLPRSNSKVLALGQKVNS